MAATRLRVEDDAADLPDAALIHAGAAGDRSAIAELYRRHSQPAWRVARSVVGNDDDANDAVAEAFAKVVGAITSGRAPRMEFRPYLLAATRNAAIDQFRRADRQPPSGDMEEHDRPSATSGPSELLVVGDDSSKVVEAFLGLPARWQSVLWLIEVEGVPAREAAGVLGLSPNNVSQLAVRARNRLRERYLQAHVRNHAAPGCQPTVDHIGAYLAGTLAPGTRTRVDVHLEGCDDCRDRLAQLDDVGRTLRRAVGAAPAAAGLASRFGHRRRPHLPHGAQVASVPPSSTAATAGAPAVAASEAVVAAASAVAPLGRVSSPVQSLVARAPAVAGLGAIPLSAVGPMVAAGPTARIAARALVALLAAFPLAGGGSDPAPSRGGALAVPVPVTAAPAEPAPEVTTTTTPPAADQPPAVVAPMTARPPAGPLPTTSNPHTTVAEAVVPAVTVRGAPGGAPVNTLANPQPSGAPLVFLALAHSGDWVQVLLPTRPNGSVGWVASSDVELSEHAWSIVVELGNHRLTVFDGTTVYLTTAVGVGTTDTPTPGGLYYTKELIEPLDSRGNLNPSGPYGPYAYGLSGFSEVLSSFGGGPGVIGIHGTNDPSALGNDVSHGCLRVSNEVITSLAGVLPLGVPVEIRA